MRTRFSVPYKLSIERQQEKNTGQIWKNEEKMSCQAEESMEAFQGSETTQRNWKRLVLYKYSKKRLS